MINIRSAWLVSMARLALGAFFAYAGFIKLNDAAAFAGDIAGYRILPYFGNYLVAAILPWLELLCGLLIITGFRARGAAMIVIGLNVVFLAALASAWIRGLEIGCGCFGAGEKSSIPAAILRDMVLLSLSLWIYRSLRQPSAPDSR